MDEERAAPDLPERLTAPKRREELGLGVGEPEQLPRERQLVRRLGVDDLRLGVGQEAFGQSHLAAALGAGRAEVGEPVHDEDDLLTEGSGELHVRLEPFADAEDREDLPGLVDDDDELGTAVPDHGLEPCGGAGHQDRERRGVVDG